MENYLRLNLILFGDGDETETAPVEDTGSETDQEPNEDLAENGQEEQEPDFEDSEGEDDAEQEQQKKAEKEKSQIKEQNRINAERRLQEKHKKELEAERKKAYMDGLKFAIGGNNPYTQTKIEDEFDLQVYKTMKEMDEKGLDPIEDYPKYVAEQMRAEKKAEIEKENEQKAKNDKIAKDIQSFDEKYGEGSASNLLNDEDFKNSKFANLLGRLSLGEVYELYTDTQAKIKNEADRIDTQKKAVAMSSPGKPGNNASNPKSFIQDILNDDKKFKEFQAQLVNRY